MNMKKILVVDDMAVFREPIAASLRLAGYETLCAAEGEESLRLTRAHHPDLIVLDVSMPKMDGIAFLRHLRADAATAGTRVILLTALSEKRIVMAAGALGVRDYLLKSRFRLKDLLERVAKLTAPDADAGGASGSGPGAAGPTAESAPASASGADTVTGTAAVPSLLTRERFLDRIEGLLQAKTLSGVTAQVIALANSPRGDTAQLAGLIAQDPMLAARVLQAANSAAYASAGAVVTTIPDAIRKIGCATVRNVAAALGVFDCVPEAGPDRFDPIRCWQHSFAVAQLCERLAADGGPAADQAGLAYVVGLCHDLGEIFIRTQFGREYQQVVDAAARTGRPVEQLQWEMLGMTHAQMIGAIFKCMSLPQAIREPIEAFHAAAGGRRSTHPLARLLWLAENYANAAMIASGPSSEVAPAAKSFCRAAIGSRDPAWPDPRTLRCEVLTLTVTLARLSRADEAKLLAPMFERRPARVWVARERALSDVDPIGMSLAELAEVAVHDRLPIGPEFDAVDGVVVVAASGDAAGFSWSDVERAQAGPRTGRAVLAVACDRGQAADLAPWRTSVSLADMARFVAALPVGDRSLAAA